MRTPSPSGTRSARSRPGTCRATWPSTWTGDEQAVSLWRAGEGLRILIVPGGRLDRAAAQVASDAVPYEFKLPDLGEGLTEGEVARWLVAEGDEIAEDQPLVEIQTDKTTVEIPSPAAGTVTSIRVAEGDVVPVGTVLVVIGGGRQPSRRRRQVTVCTSTRGRPGRRARTGSRRRRSSGGSRRSSGVDLATVSPTGPGGRVTEDDVRAAAGPSNSLLQAPSEGRREKVRGVRRQIVEHLTRAHREVPAVTYVEECDFSNVDLQAVAADRAEGDRALAAGVSRAERPPRG